VLSCALRAQKNIHFELEFVWDLEFGIWDLEFPLTAVSG